MKIMYCQQCGGKVRSESIGWKCESCQGFIDMQGGFHPHKDESFVPPMTYECHEFEECEYNGQPECRLPDGMDCPHGVKADKHAAESWMDIEARTENEKLRAELEQVKRALAEMWFAYENKDGAVPHDFEEKAVATAQEILGPWGEAMKWLK